MTSFLTPVPTPPTPLPTRRARSRLRDASERRPSRPAHFEELVTDAVERATEPVLLEVRRIRRHLDVLREQRAPQLPKYLTAEQAADIAGVTPETVRKWTRQGDLPAQHAGRLLRVRLDDLEAYLAREGRPPESDKFLDSSRVAEILAGEQSD